MTHLNAERLWRPAILSILVLVFLIASWYEGSRLAPALTVIAIVTATYVGWQASRAADRQAQEATKAVLLDNRPLLVPVHDLAGTGVVDLTNLMDLWPAQVAHPGARMEMAVGRATRIFAVNKQTGRALVYLENAGSGPAIVLSASLVSLDGQRRGDVRGTNCLRPGAAEVLVGTLPSRPSEKCSIEAVEAWLRLKPGAIREGEIARLRSEWTGEDLQKLNDRIFLLRVDYDDVFEGGPARTLKAWFDPRESGHWEVVTPLTVPLSRVP